MDKQYFLLIGLFLLISFILPFTVEGGALTIQDCTCSGAGKIITFNVNITRSSGAFGNFGFDVKYDPDILEYKNEIRGKLAKYIVVLEHGNYLEIQGSGNLDGKQTGRLVRLNFLVKKCEETTLELTHPRGDFWGWWTSSGYLIKTKNERSVYVSPAFGLPWPTLNTIGFPEPLFPGYFPPAFSGYGGGLSGGYYGSSLYGVYGGLYGLGGIYGGFYAKQPFPFNFPFAIGY